MADDDILVELGADWRRQSTDLGRMRRLTERRRRRALLALAAKAVGTGAALVAGIWFMQLALSGETAVFALSGLMLLSVLPLMLMELKGTARLARIGASVTPASALHAAREQAMAARRLLWATRIAALLLAASAAGLILLYVAGRASAGDAATFAPAWLVVALSGWLWQARRGRRLDAEIASCDIVLGELNKPDEA